MIREKISCVYKITSPSGRVYIGQTMDYYRRLNVYKNPDRIKTQQRLRNSIKKHGWHAHKFEILEKCDRLIIHEREIYWIKTLDTFNTVNGLNLTMGGE